MPSVQRRSRLGGYLVEGKKISIRKMIDQNARTGHEDQVVVLEFWRRLIQGGI